MSWRFFNRVLTVFTVAMIAMYAYVAAADESAAWRTCAFFCGCYFVAQGAWGFSHWNDDGPQ